MTIHSLAPTPVPEAALPETALPEIDVPEHALLDVAPPEHARPPERSSRPRVLARSEVARRLGREGLRRALADRRWCELWPGVLVPGEHVRDPVTRGAAALLRAGPGAVLSAGTAVAMHGCEAASSPVVELTVPYDRQLRSRPGLVVHQGRIAEFEVVELDGLRTQVLDAALAELLCRSGCQVRALACVQEAMRQAESARARFEGPGESAERLRAMVAERVAGRRDRRGTRRARAVLELARDPGGGPTSASETVKPVGAGHP